MEHVCPVCNGLSKLQETCKQCGSWLEDDGPMTDFVGPYSPYELTPQVHQKVGTCIHLLTCTYCQLESYAIVRNDVI
ncbi:hypothetical protein DNHGIG_37930 [Collibacillus ludicampi]|jgi:hypothetical protein|uniref:Uncharacterized protein n=1 Tax=Collibacillus ludicampi TaxID=2771369 RepID=A0AAV4LKC2_9BACL|nr:hypothetical protein [Collibacillus ludicampi]GIM48244.1 hypothetical protein DNHGIG_37930 [Collibacillus ludicampi]